MTEYTDYTKHIKRDILNDSFKVIHKDAPQGRPPFATIRIYCTHYMTGYSMQLGWCPSDPDYFKVTITSEAFPEDKEITLSDKILTTRLITNSDGKFERVSNEEAFKKHLELLLKERSWVKI